MRKSNLPYFRDFPIDFRKDDINAISDAINKNFNLQFIGAKGSGKSLTFRAIKQLNIFKNVEVFLIDFNLIPEKSSLSVLNLIWGAMNGWENSNKLSEGEIVVNIQNKFNQIESRGKRILFLFDSFENLTDLKEKLILNSLGSLIDSNRDLITCVFSLESPINEKILGRFAQIYYVAMLSKADFEWFIGGLQDTYGKQIDSKSKKLIFETSGGFMALVKRLFEIWESGENLEYLIQNPENNIHLRYQLDLISESENNLKVPILENYIKDIKSPNKNGDNLTVSEFKLLSYLGSTKGQICSREDIIFSLWGENASFDVSNHALDQLIHRLKKKLDETEMKIETVRGRGYRLV